MKIRLLIFTTISFLLFGVLLTGEISVAAQSKNFYLTHEVISAGGITSNTGEYILSVTFGQPIIGNVSSGEYQIGVGFWAQFLEQITDFFAIFLPLLSK